MNAHAETEASAPAWAPMDKILPAIAKAMGSVTKVAKSDRNKHDGYDFASIDAFLSLVNPICAENGLIVHMEEAEREYVTRKGRNGENTWLRQTYAITLMHSSGQYLPTTHRTAEVLCNGAQAYGSVQSYVLKQYLRSLFLIATGDKDDADHQATDTGRIEREPSPQQQAYERDVAAQIANIGRETDLASLSEYWRDLSRRNKSVARDPRVIGAKDAKKAELEAAEPEPLDDEIPY